MLSVPLLPLAKQRNCSIAEALLLPYPAAFLQSLEELAQSETRPVSRGGRGLLPAGEGRGETKLASMLVCLFVCLQAYMLTSMYACFPS